MVQFHGIRMPKLYCLLEFNKYHFFAGKISGYYSIVAFQACVLEIQPS